MFLVTNALTGKTEVIGEAKVRGAIKTAIGISQVEQTIRKMQDGSALFGDERDKTYRWVWTREEWAAHQTPHRLHTLRDYESASMARAGALEGA